MNFIFNVLKVHFTLLKSGWKSVLYTYKFYIHTCYIYNILNL